jgi:hypothetical protein
MKPLTFLAVASLLVVAAIADADPAATHTGVLRSARIELRYRPKSWAAASVERTLDAAERDLDRIAKSLDMKLPAPVVLYLYDDVAELSAITTTSGNGGFTAGTVVHIPYANDQTRLHEMTHAVAHMLPRSGDDPRNAFFEEGIANAVVEFVDGIPVHAVAALALKDRKLPTLAELTGGDFYDWLAKHPGVDGYDIAASWFRFLIDRYGAAKARGYYTGTAAKQAFGEDLPALEGAWRDFLAKYPLREETEMLLRYRAGDTAGYAPWVTGLPADVEGRPADWTPLIPERLELSDLTKWNKEDGVITGTNPAAEWTTCEFKTDPYTNCAVRARVRTAAYCGLRVQIGPLNQAMLVGPGTFLFRGEQISASSPATTMTQLRRDTDFVLVRRGNTLDVWIDGVKALTGPAVPGEARIAIGVAQGTARFTDVRVRKLLPAIR